MNYKTKGNHIIENVQSRYSNRTFTYQNTLKEKDCSVTIKSQS